MSITENTNRPFTVALCGNPNSGKTTLFNLLTGDSQKVGNWPGVTVEKKTGQCKKFKNVFIVDTPGIYSLSPFTPDEIVAQNYLLKEKPDVIINVIDSTNLERNLLLTSQLTELDCPVILALNMTDEATDKGIEINKEKLENLFGCKTFFISARKNVGVDEMLKYCVENKFSKQKCFTFSPQIEKALNKLLAVTQKMPHSRLLTVKLAENDPVVTEIISLTAEQKQYVKEVSQSLRDLLNGDVATEITKQRYGVIFEKVGECKKIRGLKQSTETRSRTEKIDGILLNKWLAFPLFALIMFAIFYLSIGGLGGFLTDVIDEKLTPFVSNAFYKALEPTGAKWLQSLICDGVIGGVMSVVSFVPQVMLLFGCISVLEDSGYMARVAFITDRLLNDIGLGGRSFVAMILGCGCAVPAIMSTRTIKNEKERNKTVTLAPLMPCSAKLAIISFFTTNVLGGNAVFAVSFYFLSVAVIILGGLVLKFIDRHSDSASDLFVMELPTYRMPSIKNVAKQMWERGKAFIVKAGTIIFVASVALWLLQSFDFSLKAADKDESILASIGKIISPLFSPLGFDDGGYGWAFSVATLTGITAKETVITTLEILLPQGVSNSISNLGAYCFVAFNLLTVPCIAAISAGFSEQGSVKNGAKSALFQICLAYAVTLTIYQTGKLFQNHFSAAIVILCSAALSIAFAISIKTLLKRNKTCRGCNGCLGKTDCKRIKR